MSATPMASLKGKKVVLGVTGSIAAYKSVLLARELMQAGADVRVVMSESATKFVGAATFEGLTNKQVVTSLWDQPGEVHVELGAWANMVVVAPATADVLAKANIGAADNALLATLLCTRAPICFVPAMHHTMWTHPATQAAVASLRSQGVHFIGPETGALASGEHGLGRMTEPQDIAKALSALFLDFKDLENKSIVITAGPTIEDIDPVRFISNRSSGKMGYALAVHAAARGANVTLISGPVSLPAPEREGVHIVRIRSAEQMKHAVEVAFPTADVMIMAAAVADFRPEQPSDAKLPKAQLSESLRLVPNTDILRSLSERRGTSRRPVLVGFALETSDELTRANEKLIQKGCDLIVANRADEALETDVTSATIVSKNTATSHNHVSKHELAREILNAIKKFSSHTEP